jgi:hypothetical protein
MNEHKFFNHLFHTQFRTALSATVLQGHIYAIGGYNVVDTVGRTAKKKPKKNNSSLSLGFLSFSLPVFAY